MNENESLGFEEFESAFADNGYQTEETVEGIDETETAAEDSAADGEEAAQQDGDENAGSEDGPADSSAEREENRQEDPAGETFTLKVNKQEVQVKREEMISLAQKGADYDRIKEQLNETRATMDALREIAKNANMELSDLVTNLQIHSMMKQQNISEEVARERVRANRAETENAKLKAEKNGTPNAEEASKDRAQREIAEFREAYPTAELTEELVNSLMDDVRGGTSLKAAYEKRQSALKDARIAELESQLEAERKNRSNRASSPGSLRDSGGRRGTSDHDSFEQALFG